MVTESGLSEGGPGSLTLRGGRSCLDFTNTVDPRTGVNDRDYLVTYGDLVTWAVHAGVLTQAEARPLLREAARDPVRAGRALARAVALREAIYRIFVTVARSGRPSASDLDILNGVLAEALARSRVVSKGRGFTWEWPAAETELDRILWPLARSAGELLVADELSLVRECAGEGCGWLFLDASKNHSRRWCTMGVCGNRAKARRHYERTHRRRPRSGA